MKFLSLRLTAFGPFTRTVLTFSPPEKGLHLIYGANEAGKSSALRALKYALFGIPERCSDDFVHPYSRMRIGADIQRSDGQILSFVRRKGRTGTLRDSEDSEPLNDHIIGDFLPGVDEGLFFSLFGIDHTVLIQGGEEIISGGGDIGQVLFSAGSGISDFRKIQAGLQAEADRLFKPGGKTPLINEYLNRLKSNRKMLRETSLSGSDWEVHDQSLRAAESEKLLREQELAEWTRSRSRLERIRHALPLIARRADCLSELSRYQDVPLLPADFSERRQELASLLRVTEAEISRIQAGLAEIDLAEQEILVADNLMNQGTRIEFFHQKLGEFLKSSLDRPRLKGVLSGLLSEAAALLAGIRPDLSLEEIDDLKLKKSEILSVQELCSRYEHLTGSLQTLHQEAPRYEIKLDHARKSVDRLPLIPDTTELISLVESVRLSGNPELQLQELEQNIRKCELRLSVGWKNVSSLCPSVSDAFFPAAPDPETIDRFESEFRRLADQSESRKASRREAEDHLAQTRNQLDRLQMEQDPPSESDLATTRKNRDRLWETLKNADWPLNAAMIADYEHQLHLSDELSDRLRREADRVARKAGLLAEEQMLRLRLDRIFRDAEATETQAESLRTQWEDLWKPFGFQPLTPPEMRPWIRRYTELENQTASLRESQARREELLQKLSDQQERLSRALRTLGFPEPENFPLQALLETANRVIRKADLERNRLESLTAEIRAREGELRDTRLRIRELENRLEEWRRQWAGAVRPLGLDANASPSLALGILDDLKSLWEKRKEADGYHKRIEGIDRDMEEYTRMVQEFAASEAPELRDFSLEKMVTELHARLNRAREASAKKQELENQRGRLEKDLEEAQIRKKEIEIRLDGLCREARGTCLGELAEIERRSEIRRRLEAEKDQLEQEISRFSAGAGLEEFIADVRKADPDTIEADIRRLEEKIDSHTRRKSELDQVIGREHNELARMDGNHLSADLAEDCESLLASIGSLARIYARLKLSSHLLAQAVERYREKHQGPLMRRSSELFARMTRGRFQGLRLEYTEKGDGYLAGVRPGGETVTVSGMSDGSADQLYLAVRLAGLEAYLEKREPIPFVIDDILIQFDDERAAATLRILAELSEKTQILFFTHHRHLIDLAERNLDTRYWVVHRMESGRQSE